MSAKIRAGGVVLQPHAAAEAEDGELYRDEDNGDTLTDKSTAGEDAPIGASSSDTIMTKLKQNTSGVTIPANTTVALKSDGGIIKADSDDIGTQIGYGVLLEELVDEAIGRVALIGPNAPGVLAGLGFAPGDTIWLNQDGTNRGFTNDFETLTGDNDSIIRFGYADCAAGEASGLATDLVMFAAVEARP